MTIKSIQDIGITAKDAFLFEEALIAEANANQSRLTVELGCGPDWEKQRYFDSWQVWTKKANALADLIIQRGLGEKFGTYRNVSRR
jgi:hypothetical protein